MFQNVARRPRFKRVLGCLPMRLTDRDNAILDAVCHYRFLSTSHILSLVSGSRQNIVRRLQRLYHAGFVERPKAQMPLRYAGELYEIVYSPTRKTLSRVATESGETGSWGEPKAVSSLFLAHYLAISDALIRLQRGFQLRGAAFISQSDLLKEQPSASRFAWRVTIRAGTDAENVGVVPDATFAIEQADFSGGTRRRYYFLEADRGTMPLRRKSLRQSSIQRKTLAYRKSRNSRTLKEKLAIPGFQVIFIARSTERLKHIKEVCNAESEGGRSPLFLFATQDELHRSDSPLLDLIFNVLK